MKKRLKLIIWLLVFMSVFFSCKTTEKIATNKKINTGVDILLTNTFQVEYDYVKGTYEQNNLRPKVNTPVIFKILNINRLAYNVSVACRDSILAESNLANDAALTSPKILDEELKAAERIAAKTAELAAPKLTDKGDFTKAAIKEFGINSEVAIAVLNSKLSESQSLSVEIAEIEKKINDLNITKEDLILKINETEKKLQEVISDSVRAKEVVKKDIYVLTKNSIDTLISQQNDTLIKKKEENKKNVIDKIAFENFRRRNDEVSKTFENLRLTFNNILKIKYLNNEVSMIVNDPLLTYPQYSHKYKSKVEELLSKAILIANDINAFEDNYYKFNNEYDAIKYNWELQSILEESGRQKLFWDIENKKKYADRMNEEFNKLDLRTVILKMQEAAKLMDNPETYSLVSSPIQPIYDVVIFDVDIQKKNKDGNSFHNERKFSHKEFTTNGMRLDFSLGMAASYFHNAPTYDLGVNTAGNISILQEQKHLFVPSFLGLFTASYRNARHLAIGASVGLGIDATDGKLQLNNFFAGPSLIWGKQERVSLTLGGTLKSIAKLKSNYEIGQEVGTATDIINFTKEVYKFGFFISITYNLTKGVKKQLKNVKYNSFNYKILPLPLNHKGQFYFGRSAKIFSYTRTYKNAFW